jgi:hypothetical protein
MKMAQMLQTKGLTQLLKVREMKSGERYECFTSDQIKQELAE